VKTDMELHDLETLIRGRRSVRQWLDKEVPLDSLTKAVELATWAPNAGNRQNWHFSIVVNRGKINSIADAVQTSVDEMVSWPEAKEFPDVVKWRERASFFRSAPAAIAIGVSAYDSAADAIISARRNDPRANQMRVWRDTADTRIQTAASAIAYLLLVLHQMGLGAVWMTGPAQAAGEVERILGMPPGCNLVAFIPVGYPAETPSQPPRRPLEEVCEVIK
jgi:nitroreductase